MLFDKHNDQVLNKGFRYINGYIKSYEQNKKVYHMHIIQELCVKMALIQNH